MGICLRHRFMFIISFDGMGDLDDWHCKGLADGLGMGLMAENRGAVRNGGYSLHFLQPLSLFVCLFQR